ERHRVEVRNLLRHRDRVEIRGLLLKHRKVPEVDEVCERERRIRRGKRLHKVGTGTLTGIPAKTDCLCLLSHRKNLALGHKRVDGQLAATSEVKCHYQTPILTGVTVPTITPSSTTPIRVPLADVSESAPVVL